MIGVHTPEFEFEKNVDNVRRAVRQMRIEYPIVIDNDYSIWRAFKNQYWPALYFIDARGRVRQHHFGEGEYDRSEMAIQRLLAEAGVGGPRDGVVSVDASGVETAPDWDNLRSPENYVGYDRTQNFASPGGGEPDRRRLYAAPPRSGAQSMGAGWRVDDGQAGNSPRAVPTVGSCIAFTRATFISSWARHDKRHSVRFRVSIGGQPPGPAHGVDLDEGGNGTVVEPRLYQLIRQPKPIIDRQFEIEFLDAGVETFAFTFG